MRRFRSLATPEDLSELPSLAHRVAERFARTHPGIGEDEYLAEAYFKAGVAALGWDGRGDFLRYVGWAVQNGLKDVHIPAAIQNTLLHRAPMDALQGRAAPENWDSWCRKLAAELEGDAAQVVLAALEAPGEVVSVLLGAGWSGPRVMAALRQVREVVG